MIPDWVKNKTVWGHLVLIIVHLVGITGILIPDFRSQILVFTPANLLMSAGLIVAFAPKKNLALLGFVGIAFVTGILVEVLGVATGMIFGEYYYGATLGWKVADVPLTIGLNWLMLVLATGSIATALVSSKWLRVVLGASLMTGLDFLIEPIAIQLDFWHWPGGVIPIQNYLAWWVIAAFLHFCFQTLAVEKSNKMAYTLFGMQIVFFATLNLLI